MDYLPRGLDGRLRHQLQTQRLVILEGARATGKTRLAQHLVGSGVMSSLVSFLDDETRAAATAAPNDFVRNLPHGTVIDEVQLFEEITLALKDAIDGNSQPGQFLITGSTRLRRNALGGSDPLAGRVGSPLLLTPMTVSERQGQPIQILDQLLGGDPGAIPVAAPLGRSQLVQLVAAPGLPGLVGQRDRGDVTDRARSYVPLVTSLQSFSGRNVQGVNAFARFVAGRTATMVNVSDFARKTEMGRNTVDEYLALLVEALLVRLLPGWRPSPGKVELTRPKLHFFDPGMAAAIGRLQPTRSDRDLGQLVETFVVSELAAQAAWLRDPPTLSHWRTRGGDEVDLVVETSEGTLLCVEVKSSESVRLSDFRGIDAFRSTHQDRQVRGVVFYAGTRVNPFGDDRWAIPFGALVGPTVNVDQATGPDTGPSSSDPLAVAPTRPGRGHASPALRQIGDEIERQLRELVDTLEPWKGLIQRRTSTTTGTSEENIQLDLYRQDTPPDSSQDRASARLTVWHTLTTDTQWQIQTTVTLGPPDEPPVFAVTESFDRRPPNTALIIAQTLERARPYLVDALA